MRTYFRNFTLSLFILSLTPLYIYSQSGWFVQFTGFGSFGNPISISFPTTLTGYIATYNPVIKTTDGGFTWSSTSQSYALSVCFKDANTGYTCSNMNLDVLDGTINGGNSWNRLCTVAGVLYQFNFPAITTVLGSGSPLVGGFGLYNAPHTPPYGAFILGNCYNAYGSYDSTTIRKMRSEQTGRVWGVGDRGYFVHYQGSYSEGTINSNANFTGVSFGDTLYGFIVGGSYVYKTTDNGSTWTQITPISNGFYYDVKFINRNTGWIAGGQTGVSTNIFHTSNAGVNWDIQWSSSGVHSTPYDICFATNDTGWVSFYDGLLLKYGIPPVPAAPVLTSPPNNSTGLPLSDTLKWNASNWATSYRVQVATDSLFNNLFLNDSIVTTTLKYVTGLSSFTNYWWRVNAKNAGGTSAFSTPFKFTTALAAPPPPVLVSPPNNSTGLPVNDTLKWNASSGAASYRLQIATDSLFNNLFLNDSTITNSWRYVTGFSNSATYWWRVNAKNAGGTSGYSSVFKFSTIIAPPAPPVLVYPPNNAVSVSTTTKLLWNVSASATSYHVQVASDSNFTVLKVDSTITIDSMFVPAGRLLNNTRYYWHVRASNVGGNSNYSVTFNFTTVLMGILNNGEIPLTYKLYQNYPNPFNPVTKIKFDIPSNANKEAVNVNLAIYDIIGREVAEIVNEKLSPGTYEVEFNGSNYPSGVYFYTIRTNEFTKTKKLILLK